MNRNEYVQAYDAFISLGNYKDSRKNAHIIFSEHRDLFFDRAEEGDYILFGTYEQDNNSSNGKEDIEWLVLDKEDDKMLVISKYALDCKPYNEEYEYITWEECTLRSWLNDEFINSAFSNTERNMIPKVTVEATANPEYDTDPGNDTKDKVFLLSINEVNKYFDSDYERICNATEYAEAQGAYTYEYDSTNKRSCWWWLRSPGGCQGYAALVSAGGDVNYGGGYVDGDFFAVRPALWITFD